MANNNNKTLDLRSDEKSAGKAVSDYGRSFIDKINPGKKQEAGSIINKNREESKAAVVLPEDSPKDEAIVAPPSQTADRPARAEKFVAPKIPADSIPPIKLAEEKTAPEPATRNGAPAPGKEQKEILEFPANFLWGTATSAYQVEGGNVNDWSEWETNSARIKKLKRQGLDPNDYICGPACDSFNRYEEDFDLAQKLNTNAIRFGVEWSRIEPKEGVWNVEAINRYRAMAQAAKKRGFKVALTLWHWTNPAWVAAAGGWGNKKTAESYKRYVEVVVEEMGAYVDYWVTFNEPMVPLAFGYLLGVYPPGKKLSPYRFFQALNNLAEANNGAYDLIHDRYPEAMSGVTMLINYNKPARRWFLPEWALAKIADYFTVSPFLRKISDSVDFIGLDYYKMNRFVWYPPFKRNLYKHKNDMGWEVYPAGIYRVLKRLKKYDLPVLILENGTADADDDHRAAFITEHLRFVHRAIKEGIDVRGYFYWSLLDNFEWAKGYGPKFGLYRVDRDTFWRSRRPSAKVYAEICRSNSLIVAYRT